MSNFTFSASDDSTQENSQAPSLQHPYLGPATLSDVRIDALGENDEWDVLTFEWTCHGPNETVEDMDSDKVFRDTLFPPRESDLQPREEGGTPPFQRTIDLIAYRLKYFLGEEQAKAAATTVDQFGNDPGSLTEAWDNLRENVVQAIDEVGYSEKTVRIKVVGNAYTNSNGERKTNVQFTRYPGFISDEDSDHPASFSRNEKQENNEYRAEMNKQPASSNDMAAATGGDGVPADAPEF